MSISTIRLSVDCGLASVAAIARTWIVSFYCLAALMVLLPLNGAYGDDLHRTSISGCMTTACHGSNVADSKTWQRAGKIWFDQDPHAQAYTSLLTEASAKIVSRLADEELKPSSQAYRDVLNAKCVSCHSNENVPEAQRVLGVDCQVCHGSSDAWGSQHYSSEWKALGSERFDNSQMLNAESSVSRAKICSSCHIGELDRTSGLRVRLDREVDHRMMAAGHPPLYFDFEDYSRRYPVHWDTSDESTGLGSTKGLERWRTGKITSAITRLNQLSIRAERSTRQTDKTGDWPELTEYSCTNCHHSLYQPYGRRAYGTNAIADWDDWCISQLDCAIREPFVNELNAHVGRMKNQMEQISPDPRAVLQTAKSMRQLLERELSHASSSNENNVEFMLKKLKSRVENVSEIRNWESATQWYIATRVLSEGLGIEGSKLPVSLVNQDPFLSDKVTWKRSDQRNLNFPSAFHPDMLADYRNALIQLLRSRP